MASTNKTVRARAPVARLNTGLQVFYTGKAEQLRRTLMTCLLWEKGFYEDGVEIAKRLTDLANTVNPSEVFKLAYEAKHEQLLRHAPLWLLSRLLINRTVDAASAASLLTRVDDLAELVVMYWSEGKRTLSKTLRRALALALERFDEYQLGKWNRKDKDVTLRDVLRLIRVRPSSIEVSTLWSKVVHDELASPETWENRLSRGEKPVTVFTELVSNDKLGELAFLRNLRKMEEVGVNRELLKAYLDRHSFKKILPFQFLIAADYAPFLTHHLEQALFRGLSQRKHLDARTAFLIDVSGSMKNPVSDKSELRRIDAAAGVAVLAREVFTRSSLFDFDGTCRQVPAAHRGWALRKSLRPDGGTTLIGSALRTVGQEGPWDLVIIVTDEESHDRPNVKDANARLVVIVNVAQGQFGVMYNTPGVVHVSGWSKSVIDYIIAYWHELNGERYALESEEDEE